MDTGQIIFYALLALVILVWLRRRMLIASIPQVTREEAEGLARTGEAVLVDVRTAQERSRSTLAGSVHLPMSDITSISARLGQHKAKQVIFFCATGSRSVLAASRARKHGFTVANLRGGIGW